MIDPDGLPASLVSTDRALLWRREKRDEQETKVPYRPGYPSEHAAVNDPETWGSFWTALADVQDGEADGVGVVLGNGIVGVDLDDCRNPDTGELADWARKIVDRLDSYTEVSPSGTGLHVLARGRLPDGRRRKGHLEMYSDGRYFTVTGDHLEGTPAEIEERTAELAALHAQVFENVDRRDEGARPRPSTPLDVSDRELLERARAAGNGSKFEKLWSGVTSGYDSHSEADLALVNLLAFWTRGDIDRIDRLFRRSGLMREKWEREDYRERTISAALEGRTDYWEPRRDGARSASGASGDAEGGWGDPISLGPEPPADLPSEVLPSPLRDHVESVAANTQTPVGLPLTVGLAAASATVAGKADLQVRRGWREPVNLYLAAVLDPANRKSPVEKAMVAPLREYEREEAREVGPEQRAALDRKEALEKRLSRAQKALSKADGAEEEGQALSDLEDARRRIEELEVPTPPRLLTDDVTPEALGRIMDENAGRGAIISSEGDVLRIFAGRYSSTGDPTLDIIKKAWSGDSVRVDRVGRDGAHLPRPLLTVGLTVQPTLLRTLGNREVLDGEGVLARFLWMAPPSLIGDRLTGADVPAPDEEARAKYECLLRALLDLEPADVDEETGEWRPHVLELSSEARDLLYGWEDEVEELLADGGELAPIRSWGGKLVGTTVRLAGVLHLVERTGQEGRPFAAPVSRGAMEAAVRLARSFVPHARHVLAGEVGMDEEIKLARYVLRRIREADDDELTVRDLWQLTRGKAEIEEVADLRGVLARLEAHRLVRVVERESTGGRPPSPWVRLNPRARENIPKSPTSPQHEDRTPTSGSFGDTDPRGASEAEPPPDADEGEEVLL